MTADGRLLSRMGQEVLESSSSADTAAKKPMETPVGPDDMEESDGGDVDQLIHSAGRNPAKDRFLLAGLRLDVREIMWRKGESAASEFVLSLRTAATQANGPSLFDVGDSWTLRESLLQGRVVEEVYDALSSVDGEILAALEHSGLLEKVLAIGLNYQVGEYGCRLSGGQRQKVALGRVLLKNPSLLMLDEPTASLDELSQNAVIQAIDNAAVGRTVMAVSHRLELFRSFDRVLRIDNGTITWQGTPTELQNLPDQPPEVATTVTSADVIGLARVMGSLDLFSRLGSHLLTELARRLRVMECEQGEVLFYKGDPGENCFVILDGAIEFFDQHNETEIPMDVFQVGQLFGELALLGDGHHALGGAARARFACSCCGGPICSLCCAEIRPWRSRYWARWRAGSRGRGRFNQRALPRDD